MVDATSPNGMSSAARSVLRSLVLTVAASLAAWAMDGPYALGSQSMAYLLSVVFAAFRYGRLDAILAAFLGVAALNFLFVPPRYTLSVENGDYGFMLLALLIVSLVVSGLATRLRSETAQAQVRERRAREMHALADLLAEAGSLDDLVLRGSQAMRGAFGDASVLLPDPLGALEVRAGLDADAAKWVLKHGVAIGPATGYWPELGRWYVPLPGDAGTLGAASVPAVARSPEAMAEDLAHLEAIARQVGLALQREQLARRARDAELEARAESQRNALLASISHDLRTPLAAILGAATTLTGQKLGDTERDTLLRSIEDEARQMTATAENILQLARLTADGVSLRRDWQSVGEIAGTVVGRLRRRGEQRLRLEIDAALPLVEIDPVLIEKLLANLIDNALRHAPGTGPVEVRVAALATDVEVQVRDRGPGFGRVDPATLFAKFRRGSNAAQGGAGLGLAICKAIVDLHGGTIEAANREGGGAAVRVTLPRGGVPPSMQLSGVPPSMEPGGEPPPIEPGGLRP
jgi:two-component system sensor histidine kinase KdpD